MGYKGMSSPGTNKITNPLKNGSKAKRLKQQHAATLSQSGLREPKSPL